MDLPSQITREGCPLHFWLTGPTDRPLIVFTHGAGVDHREWLGTLPLLTQNYRVLTWDVRSHGLSRPTGNPFTLSRVTNDLLAILDAVGVEQAILVGHSMGGNISQEVLFRAPERVQFAVLLGCTSNTQKLSPLEHLEICVGETLLKMYPYELLLQQSANISTDLPSVRAYLYEAFKQMNKTEFTTIIIELLKGLHEEPEYKIPVPFLLTHGDNDKSGNIRALAPIWARTEPYCEYAVIPHARHIANMDNPEVFNELLLDFLRRHVPVE